MGVPPAQSGSIAGTPGVSRGLSGHPDLQPEVPEPEIEQAPAAQVHYPGQQDDDKDDHDDPDHGNHEARDREPAHFSHSCDTSRYQGTSGRPVLLTSKG